MNEFNQFQFVSKKESGNLYCFWIGFIIYSLSFTLSHTPYATNIFRAFQLIGLGLIIVAVFFLIRPSIKSSYLQFFFIIFFAWSLLVVARGFQFNTTFIKNVIYDAKYGILPYFVPLILLIPTDRLFLKKLIDAIIVLGVFYLIFDVLFIRLLLSSDRSSSISQGIIEHFAILSIPSGFVLFTYRYHSTKRNLLALFIILVSLFLAIIRARRGLIFIFSSVLLFSFFGYFFYSKKKILILYLTVLFISILAFQVSNVYKIGKHNIFSFVLDRGDDDTRTGIELYFYDDMKSKDWIIGKGINGKYYCPDIDKDDTTGYRSVIETDYLQLILNGGLIYLVLLSLIFFPAIILGLFYSKNMLSKAAGIWIFLWICYLYPARVSTFTLHYILVWVSVGICYSKTIRNKSETAIEELFSPVGRFI